MKRPILFLTSLTAWFATVLLSMMKVICLLLMMIMLLLMQPFYSHYTGQPVLAGPSVAIWFESCS